MDEIVDGVPNGPFRSEATPLNCFSMRLDCECYQTLGIAGHEAFKLEIDGCAVPHFCLNFLTISHEATHRRQSKWIRLERLKLGIAPVVGTLRRTCCGLMLVWHFIMKPSTACGGRAYAPSSTHCQKEAHGGMAAGLRYGAIGYREHTEYLKQTQKASFMK